MQHDAIVESALHKYASFGSQLCTNMQVLDLSKIAQRIIQDSTGLNSSLIQDSQANYENSRPDLDNLIDGGIISEQNRLTSLITVTGPVQDPLAVLYLENQLYILGI